MKALEFKHFILEGSMRRNYETQSRSEEISLEKAIELFRFNCSDYDPSLNKIYRGNENFFESAFKLSNPQNFVRKSANTTNYCTLILELLDSWKPYPRRSRSLICSSRKWGADVFGNTRDLVIPFNNSKIGICPSGDFWQGFEKTLRPYPLDVSGFNRDFDYMISDYFENPGNYSAQVQTERSLTPERLLEFINKVTSDDFYKFKEKFDSKYLKKILSPNLMDFLKNIFDPEYNNFKSCNIKEYQQIPSTFAQEVWIEGPCLLLNTRDPEVIKDFFKKARK